MDHMVSLSSKWLWNCSPLVPHPDLFQILLFCCSSVVRGSTGLSSRSSLVIFVPPSSGSSWENVEFRFPRYADAVGYIDKGQSILGSKPLHQLNYMLAFVYVERVKQTRAKFNVVFIVVSHRFVMSQLKSFAPFSGLLSNKTKIYQNFSFLN